MTEYPDVPSAYGTMSDLQDRLRRAQNAIWKARTRFHEAGFSVATSYAQKAATSLGDCIKNLDYGLGMSMGFAPEIEADMIREMAEALMIPKKPDRPLPTRGQIELRMVQNAERRIGLHADACAVLRSSGKFSGFSDADLDAFVNLVAATIDPPADAA